MTRAETHAALSTLIATEGVSRMEACRRLNVGQSYGLEVLSDPTGEATRARKARTAASCSVCGKKLSDKHRKYCVDHVPNEPFWSEEALIEGLRWAEVHLGHRPSAFDIVILFRGDLASLGTYQSRFGSWSNATRAAFGTP